MSYSDDKRYGKSGYSVGSSVEAIATEIMTNGPVEAAFSVYSDFPSYKSGMNRSLCGTNNDFCCKNEALYQKQKFAVSFHLSTFYFVHFILKSFRKKQTKRS